MKFSNGLVWKIPRKTFFQDLGNGVMRVLNPTYISFVNDHEIDPWEIETDKIRWGSTISYW